MYYWTLFAGIDDNAFNVQLSVIPILFGTIIISVILMNILIAYLSNEYSRLEEKQVLEGLKTKALFNLDIEIIIALFKRISKRNRIKNNYYDSQYDQMLKFWKNKDFLVFKVI